MVAEGLTWERRWELRMEGFLSDTSVCTNKNCTVVRQNGGEVNISLHIITRENNA
jgi:hypothetical protein